MRRVPAMVMSAGAASVATLAVAVAVPALGDDGAPPKGARVVKVFHAGPPPEELRACLKKHGIDVPDAGPFALKRRLAEAQDDDPTTDALKACGMPVGPPCTVAAPGKPGAPGKDEFGVRVDGE
jgi:hypothetical protein